MSHATVALCLQAGRALAGRPPSCGPTGCGGDPRYQVHAFLITRHGLSVLQTKEEPLHRQKKRNVIMRAYFRRQGAIAVGPDLHCRVQSIRCQCRPRVSPETRASEARVLFCCSLSAVLTVLCGAVVVGRPC